MILTFKAILFEGQHKVIFLNCQLFFLLFFERAIHTNIGKKCQLLDCLYVNISMYDEIRGG